MSNEAHFLDVKIMGRDYRVACTPEDKAALGAAVNLVDSKMREIAQKTKNTLAERVAVMAALNIAHELLANRERQQEAVDVPETKRRVATLNARLASTLAPPQQLNLIDPIEPH